MTTRSFALIAGIVYLAIGLLGFIPGFVTPVAADHPPLAVDAGYGLLLGLFPINLLHNLVHLAVGVWGLVAYRRFADARSFAQGLAVIYGVLTVMGVIPGLDTTFGIIPLFGHDVWLHALTALVAAYFGFLAPARSLDETPSGERPTEIGRGRI